MKEINFYLDDTLDLLKVITNATREVDEGVQRRKDRFGRNVLAFVVKAERKLERISPTKDKGKRIRRLETTKTAIDSWQQRVHWDRKKA